MRAFAKFALVLSAAALLLVGGRALARPTQFPEASRERTADTQMRSLSGRVTQKDGGALSDAVVYLKNVRSLAVKTFIADKEGNYQFNGLAPNTDYEVYAEYKGNRSKLKTLSGFDSRTKAVINLEIELKK